MRLVDVDALINEHCSSCNEDVRNECKTDPMCGSLAWFTDAPTVEAVPVVHGRWIKGIIEREPVIKNGKVYRNDTLTFQCSKCKETFAGITNGFNFCPYCGTKMDGDQ